MVGLHRTTALPRFTSDIAEVMIAAIDTFAPTPSHAQGGTSSAWATTVEPMRVTESTSESTSMRWCQTYQRVRRLEMARFSTCGARSASDARPKGVALSLVVLLAGQPASA